MFDTVTLYNLTWKPVCTEQLALIDRTLISQKPTLLHNVEKLYWQGVTSTFAQIPSPSKSRGPDSQFVSRTPAARCRPDHRTGAQAAGAPPEARPRNILPTDIGTTELNETVIKMKHCSLRVY